MNEIKLGQVNLFASQCESFYGIGLENIDNRYYAFDLRMALHYMKECKEDKDYIIIKLRCSTDLLAKSHIQIILKRFKKLNSKAKLIILCDNYIQIRSCHLYSKLYDLGFKCYLCDMKGNVEDYNSKEKIYDLYSMFSIVFNELFILELELLNKNKGEK